MAAWGRNSRSVSMGIGPRPSISQVSPGMVCPRRMAERSARTRIVAGGPTRLWPGPGRLPAVRSGTRRRRRGPRPGRRRRRRRVVRSGLRVGLWRTRPVSTVRGGRGSARPGRRGLCRGTSLRRSPRRRRSRGPGSRGPVGPCPRCWWLRPGPSWPCAGARAPMSSSPCRAALARPRVGGGRGGDLVGLGGGEVAVGQRLVGGVEVVEGLGGVDVLGRVLGALTGLLGQPALRAVLALGAGHGVVDPLRQPDAGAGQQALRTWRSP